MNPDPASSPPPRTRTLAFRLDALPHLAGMLMVLVTLALLWGCRLTAKIVA
jgi:hypothetical protein